MIHTNRRSLLAGLTGALTLGLVGARAAAQPATRDAAVGFAQAYVDSIPTDSLEWFRLSRQGDRLAWMLRNTEAVVDTDDTRAFVSLPETLLFAHPATDVAPAAMKWIDLLAQEMLRETGTWLEVIGHWHYEDQASEALTMSARRATSIQAGLMSRGVPIDRIVASGLGDAWPLTSNDNPLGMRANRRIDLVFRVI